MGAVIFDFWGTLANGGARSPLRRTQKTVARDMNFGEFVEQFEKITMTKSFESQSDMFDQAFKSMKLKVKPQDVETLIGVWNKNALLATVFEDTIPALQELKKAGHKLALVSNTPSFHMEEVIQRLELKDYFDVVALSYKEGRLKHDEKFIHDVIKKLGVKKAETIIVGDSIETDMLVANALNMKGVLVDRRGMREYDPKIKSLAEVKNYI